MRWTARVDELALGALDLDVLADGEEGEPPRDVALLISLPRASLESARIFRALGTPPHLDDQVKVAQVVVERRRRVAPDHILAVNLGRDGDVLSDRKAEACGR